RRFNADGSGVVVDENVVLLTVTDTDETLGIVSPAIRVTGPVSASSSTSALASRGRQPDTVSIAGRSPCQRKQMLAPCRQAISDQSGSDTSDTRPAAIAATERSDASENEAITHTTRSSNWYRQAVSTRRQPRGTAREPSRARATCRRYGTQRTSRLRCAG